MRTSEILKVEVNFRHELLAIKGSNSTFSYYSNLSIAVRAIENALVLNGWELDGFNYTAIYRAMKLKGNFIKVFKAKGTAFFKIGISYATLNPKLDGLEIEKSPNVPE